MLLYDSRHYEESLEVMTQLQQSGPDWGFAATVWQGHLLDLLGRRTEAIARYQAALKMPGEHNMQHNQYNLVIDNAWVEQRLKTPFERR